MAWSGAPDDDLPPLDVVIPDDARELDADLAAYHRELSLLRVHETAEAPLPAPAPWWRRFGATLSLGVVALLLVAASAAALALLGPRPGLRPPARALAQQPTAAPGRVGGLLPDTTVLADGSERSLRELRPAVLAVVRPGCRCAAALRAVYHQAAGFGLPMFLLASAENAYAIRGMATDAGLTTVSTVVDRDGATARTIAPDDAASTFVLVHADGVVREVLTGVRPSDPLEHQLAPLNDPGARG